MEDKNLVLVFKTKKDKHIRVKELITILQQYSEDTRVILPGYEGGYDDITVVKQITIKLNANKQWYYGAHAESNVSDAESVILLFGENRNSEDWIE